ncbi:hypothetical protein DFH06DRAFT_1081455 [Mycena polygramma]|nr:hypothetical protein DFH06DRAFT_1081455 [Mycena polygramma]
MEQFPITEAQIVALFLESVFWGIYSITFVLCLRSLLFKSSWEPKRLTELNWPMLLVALGMCTFATLDVAIGLMHNIQAFALYDGPGGASEKFSDISNWVNVVKTVDVVIQTLLGDGMLVYRCWVVHSKSWVVVAASIVLWLGTAVCTVMNIQIEASLHSHALITSSSLQPVIISFWCLTISQNLLTTGLLVYRIYTIDKENSRFAYHSNSSGNKAPSRLRRVMRIILESGLMYTVTAIVTFITFISGSNSAYATSDVQVQIVGIAFNLIIIRADADRHAEGTSRSGGTIMPLQALRRQMAADAADGVRVTVVNDEFRDEGNRIKSGQFMDSTVSAM